MRRFKLTLGFTALIFFMFTGSMFAADVAKIGIVNLQRILEASSPGKDAQAQLKKQKDTMEADLKKKGAEIEEIRKRLERESMVMSKETRDEKEREQRIKINDFKTVQQKYRVDLQTLERSLMDRLRDDTSAIVTDIGKKEGYLLIISNNTVLYAPNSIDITDKLIKKLNAKHAKKGKK